MLNEKSIKEIIALTKKGELNNLDIAIKCQVRLSDVYEVQDLNSRGIL